MPRTSLDPTISQIYAAFDPAMMALFQSAIAVSRDAVVRVSDLRSTLIASTEGIVQDVMPTNSPKRNRPASSSSRGPLANDPALRELFQQCYRLAKQRSPDSPMITPAVLAETLIAETPSTPRFAPRGSPLGNHQSCPGTQRPRSEGGIAHRPASTPSTVDFHTSKTLLTLMDEVFHGWLRLNHDTQEPINPQCRAELATRTAHIERIGREY